MEFILIFGIILLLMCIFLKYNLKWEITLYSCNPRKEQLIIDANKRKFKTFIIITIIVNIVGLIGIIIF